MLEQVQDTSKQDIKSTLQQLQNAQRVLDAFKLMHPPLQKHDSLNLQISVGSAKVLEQTGKRLYVNPKHFTAEAAEEILSSITNPELVMKTVAVKLDGEIFHKVSHKGQVSYSQIDNFIQPKIQNQELPKIEFSSQKNSLQQLINELSQKELKISALTEAVETLTQTVQSLQAARVAKESIVNDYVANSQSHTEQSATLYALLSKHTETLDRLVTLMEKTQRNPMDKLDDWFQNARQSIAKLTQTTKTNLQQLPGNIKELVKEKIRELQTKTLEMVNKAKQHAISTTQQIKQEVVNQANNVKREVKDQVLTLGIAVLNRGLQELVKMGEYHPDTGQRVLKNKRGVTLVATEHSTQIFARNGLPFMRDGIPTEFMIKALSEEKYDVSDFKQMAEDVKEIVFDAMKMGVEQVEAQHQQITNQQQTIHTKLKM